MLDLLNAIALISNSYLTENIDTKKINSYQPSYEVINDISDLKNKENKKS